MPIFRLGGRHREEIEFVSAAVADAIKYFYDINGSINDDQLAAVRVIAGVDALTDFRLGHPHA